MPNAEAVIAKYNAEAASASADPAAESPSAPPAGDSAAGSAPADAATAGGETGSSTSPGATNDPPINHDELRAKLDADRERRAAKELRRKAKLEAEQAAKTKAEADAELAKWKALGKDKAWLDAIKEAGHDPAKVYEQMRQEALKAGTPEARIDALEKKYAAELEAVRAELQKERDERAAERKALDEERARAQQTQYARMFENDFRQALTQEEFRPLRDEYEDDQLLGVAAALYKNPRVLFEHAKSLNVALTARDGTFTMKDIFAVMRAQQAQHEAKRQRRNQSAAPQTGSPAERGTGANPTVNGTAERKAGTPTTLGNDIATSRASEKSEKELRATMTRDEWRAYVRKKHENAKL